MVAPKVHFYLFSATGNILIEGYFSEVFQPKMN